MTWSLKRWKSENLVNFGFFGVSPSSNKWMITKMIRKMIMKMSRQGLSDRQGNELLVETSLLYLNGLRNSLSSNNFRIWTIVEIRDGTGTNPGLAIPSSIPGWNVGLHIYKKGVLNNWSSSQSWLQLFSRMKIVHDGR